MKTYTALFLLFFSLEICAQVNPFSAQPSFHSNALIDIRSAGKYFEIPSLTTDEINNLPTTNLKEGALVYNSSNNAISVYQDFTASGVNDKWWRARNDTMGNHILRKDLTIPSGMILMGEHQIYFDDSNTFNILIMNPPGFNYEYSMQHDGNLVAHKSGSPIWSSNLSTQKHDASEAIYMNNNNIWNGEVNQKNAILFNDGRGPGFLFNNYRLILQTDGNLVVYRANHTILWESGSLSDRRSKHILSPMENILDRVMKMNLVEFKYKKEESFHVIQPKKLHFGVIAQNILQLFPRYNEDLVTGGSLSTGEKLSVDYRKYNILAIKTIQEFKKQYDENIKEIRTQVSQKTQTTDLDELKQTFHLLTQKAGEIEKKLSFLDKKTNTKQ